MLPWKYDVVPFPEFTGWTTIGKLHRSLETCISFSNFPDQILFNREAWLGITTLLCVRDTNTWRWTQREFTVLCERLVMNPSQTSLYCFALERNVRPNQIVASFGADLCLKTSIACVECKSLSYAHFEAKTKQLVMNSNVSILFHRFESKPNCGVFCRRICA